MLAAPATASLAFKVLVGSGATAGSLVGITPSASKVVVAFLIGGLGLSILLAGPRNLSVLGSRCLITGALAKAGSGVALAEDNWASLPGATLGTVLAAGAW